MDPISIITLAGSATTATYSVSKAIYEFINAVKEVDDTVQALSSEMSSLRRSLDAIGAALDNPLVRSDKARAPENAPIWAATAGALEECRKSLSAIDKKIAPHQKETARRTLFKRAITTFKLNLSKEEIANLRSQVQTHTHSLQLALQMINLLVSGIAPSAAVEDVGQEIAKLHTILENWDANKSADSSGTSVSQIQSTARDVLRKAPEFVSTGLLEGTDEDTRTKSLVALRTIVADYNRSLYSSRQEHTFAIQPFTGGSTASDESNSDSDSDDDLEDTLVRELFGKAEDRLSSKAYKEAEAYFRDGLRHLPELSKIPEDLNIETVRLKLAVCCFFQDKFEEAELMMLILTKNDRRVTEQSLRAYLYLAQIYLCLYDFESSLEYAGLAVKGSRKILGKSHNQYYLALRLLSLVYEANGDFITANAYSKKTPAGLTEYDELQVVAARFTGFSSSESLRLSLKEKQQAQFELSTADILERRGRAPQEIKRGDASILLYFHVGEDALNMPKALDWAAMNDKPLLAKWLLARGAPPNGTANDGSPLREAAYKGSDRSVRVLLASGADANRASSDGRRALYWASLWGYEICVRTLLAAGADANASTADGDTALMAAACKGHAGIVRLLLDADGCVALNARTKTGQSALLQALNGSHLECVDVLLSRGAEVDIHDRNGATPLHAAVETRKASVVRQVLDAGADVDAADNGGVRALHRSLSCKDSAIVEMLLASGTDPNAATGRNWPPFRQAVQFLETPVLRLLLEHGADPNLGANDGGLYAGAILKHSGMDEDLTALMKQFPDMRDCRDQGKTCPHCARWDTDLGLER